MLKHMKGRELADFLAIRIASCTQNGRHAASLCPEKGAAWSACESLGETRGKVCVETPKVFEEKVYVETSKVFEEGLRGNPESV